MGLFVGTLALACLIAPAAAEAAPQVDSKPTIDPHTSPPQDGETLTGKDGSFSGGVGDTIGVVRTWVRCDSAGNACELTGDTDNDDSYELSDLDVGRTIRFRNVASCLIPCGQIESDSDETAVVVRDPLNLTKPTFTGTARDGQTLNGNRGTYRTNRALLAVGYEWLRCTSANPGDCLPIDGATGQSYSLKPADVGRRMRLRVTETYSGPRRDTATSDQVSEVVQSRVGPAPKPPAPTPSPGFAPKPPAPTPSPGLLSPFPRIGIAGRARRSSTLITKFLVRAPRGSRVRIDCRGRGCPFRRASARAGRRAVRFRGLHRAFRTGTVIEVFVTSKGKIGKYTRFRFRPRRAPSRANGCLNPGAKKPTPCPSR